MPSASLLAAQLVLSYSRAIVAHRKRLQDNNLKHSAWGSLQVLLMAAQRAYMETNLGSSSPTLRDLEPAFSRHIHSYKGHCPQRSRVKTKTLLVSARSARSGRLRVAPPSLYDRPDQPHPQGRSRAGYREGCSQVPIRTLHPRSFES